MQASDISEEMMTPEQIVSGIYDGELSAMTELYAIFTRGIRYVLLRNLGAHDLDDKVHDCFVIVTQAIQNGELREPERLMGYVRTVVRYYIAGRIHEIVRERRRFSDLSPFSIIDWHDNAEEITLASERMAIIHRALRLVSRRDRDILNRFYSLEQSPLLIRREMALTFNQFRLLKSRAMGRLRGMIERLSRPIRPLKMTMVTA